MGETASAAFAIPGVKASLYGGAVLATGGATGSYLAGNRAATTLLGVGLEAHNLATNDVPVLSTRIGSVAGARSVGTVESRALTTWHPANNGFLGEARDFSLIPGARVDRVGFDGGKFLAPEGTPFPMRALPSGAESRPYSVFEVLKPINVKVGEIAPAYGQPGLGQQFMTSRSVSDLLRDGFLQKVGP